MLKLYGKKGVKKHADYDNTMLGDKAQNTNHEPNNPIYNKY